MSITYLVTWYWNQLYVWASNSRLLLKLIVIFLGLLGGNNRPKIPQIPQDPFNLFDDIFSGVANLPRDDVVEDGEVELIEPVDTNTPQTRPGCGLLCTMFG